MAGIKSNFIKNTELNKLEQSLWLDCNRYSNITYDALDDELKFTNNMASVSYQFKDTYIIKATDTFYVQLQSKTLFFDGNKVETGDIDAIKLVTSKTFQNQQLFIFKDNDATPFMN